MRYLMQALAAALVACVPLFAQQQSGTFVHTVSGNQHDTVEVTPPSDTPSTPPNETKVKITKVEQQLVGGGWADITNVVTICENNTKKVRILFGEDVNGETFRFTYEMTQTSPSGANPDATSKTTGSAECEGAGR